MIDPVNLMVIPFPNSPPTADAGGPYSVVEGSAVQLDASGSSDPNQSTSSLTFHWDLDGDGVFGETGGAAARGDEVGATPTFSAAGLDGPSSVTVSLKVVDDEDVAAASTATINIVNIAPVVTAITNTSPECGGVQEGDQASITAGFSDVGTPDTHTATIAWGDGTSSTGSVSESNGVGTVTGNHIYVDGGIYTVTVTVTDDDSGSAQATTTTMIVGAGVNGDVLQVVGSNVADKVTINKQDADTFKVIASFLASNKTFAAGGVSKIHGVFCDGDDQVTVASSITIPARLEGGEGDDKLKGGGGNDVILGGLGDDLLLGKNGRDLLVGGAGADRIVGNADDDILVAGYLNFAATDQAIDAIMAEWTSTRDYATRVANISGTGTGTRDNANYFLTTGSSATVLDDGARDVLTGSAGQDWFFANLNGGVLDKITDLDDDEFADDLDWILAP